jgi:hypothetical protein
VKIRLLFLLIILNKLEGCRAPTRPNDWCLKPYVCNDWCGCSGYNIYHVHPIGQLYHIVEKDEM